MPTIQDYAIGTLTIALLLSWGFAVSPDDTHFCRARELSYYCHDVSDSGKTCYTKPFRTGGKVCYEGWEDILKDFPTIEDDVIFLEDLYERFASLGVDVLEGGGLLETENADNFDYEKTILIQRSYDFSNLKTVARTLDFDIHNEEQVITQPSSTADVDLTLILGKDYRSVKPIKVYLAILQ